MTTTANASPSQECQFCGLIHKAMCPRIKRVEYSDMNPGHFKVVEFFAPNDSAPKLSSDHSVFDLVFGKR